MGFLFGGPKIDPPPPPPPPKPPNQLGAKQLQYATMRQKAYPLGGLTSLIKTGSTGANPPGIAGTPRTTSSVIIGNQ